MRPMTTACAKLFRGSRWTICSDDAGAVGHVLELVDGSAVHERRMIVPYGDYIGVVDGDGRIIALGELLAAPDAPPLPVTEAPSVALPSDAIAPALTPEEWTPQIDQQSYCGSDGVEEEAIKAGGVHRWASGVVTLNNEYPIDRPHAAAALCLYGQTFGFTHAEVEALTVLVREIERPYVFQHNGEPGEALVLSVLAKIRALLPPAPVIAHSVELP